MPKIPRTPREPRDPRPARVPREPRDPRPARLPREPRDPRPARPPRDPRDPRPARCPRDPRFRQNFFARPLWGCFGLVFYLFTESIHCCMNLISYLIKKLGVLTISVLIRACNALLKKYHCILHGKKLAKSAKKIKQTLYTSCP